MTHESKEDILLEKVILFLVILVGAILIFNQFQYAKLSSNILLNAMAFLLILALIGLVVWLFLVKKKGEHTTYPIEHIVKSERNPFTFFEKVSYSLVAAVALMIFFNQFQISQVNALKIGRAHV